MGLLGNLHNVQVESRRGSVVHPAHEKTQDAEIEERPPLDVTVDRHAKDTIG